MCLGIPGKVLERFERDGAPMGRVDFAGDVQEVCLSFVPDLEVGAYTIVHMGFAITVLDEESALETLGLMADAGILRPRRAG